MEIIRDRPPLYEEIDRVFRVRGRPVIFAWGTKVFCPSGNADLHPSLIAHERAHGERQLAYPLRESLGTSDTAKITAWWLRYMNDIDFRRTEEIIGHRAELQYLIEHAGGRNQRRRHVSIVATKLSSPLYGPLMSKAKAREVLDVRSPSR